MDRKALIGLLSGITVVIAMMIGVGLVNTRPAEGADSTVRQLAHECGSGKGELGYGVSPAGEACGHR